MAKYDMAPTVAAGVIRLARHKAELTQTELALRAGVTQQTVSAYETGRKEPTLPTLERLVAAAGFELRIRLEPISDHDQGLSEYLASLDPQTRVEIEQSQRDRVTEARLNRIRGR